MAAITLMPLSVVASAEPPPTSHVRSSNSRIAEVLRYAKTRSVSFEDLIATLDGLDTVVIVEDGVCRAGEFLSCVHVLPSRRVVVRVNARQTNLLVATQLAHELYHAVEIARELDVIDEPSLHALYERIGYRTCADEVHSCWDTSAARAFEHLVWKQLYSSKAAKRQPGEVGPS